MVQQVHLLKSLPKPKRDIKARNTRKTAEVIALSKCFGQAYFDGSRDYGYGGYKYDGRWRAVGYDIVKHYQLQPFARVLDVGCAKGFLVADLCAHGCDAYGLDASWYAVVEKPYPAAVGRLHIGTAIELPFPDKSFDLVLSINTLHNLPREQLKHALQEIMRVTRGPAFVQVDSYHTPEQKRAFEEWVLTAEFYGYPAEWLELFEEAGYTGDYDWTIID